MDEVATLPGVGTPALVRNPLLVLRPLVPAGGAVLFAITNRDGTRGYLALCQHDMVVSGGGCGIAEYVEALEAADPCKVVEVHISPREPFIEIPLAWVSTGAAQPD